MNQTIEHNPACLMYPGRILWMVGPIYCTCGLIRYHGMGNHIQTTTGNTLPYTLIKQ